MYFLCVTSLEEFQELSQFINRKRCSKILQDGALITLINSPHFLIGRNCEKMSPNFDSTRFTINNYIIFSRLILNDNELLLTLGNDWKIVGGGISLILNNLERVNFVQWSKIDWFSSNSLIS